MVTDGVLTKDRMGDVLRQMAGPAMMDQEEQGQLVEEAFNIADKDFNGNLSFREFAIWYSCHSFDDMYVDQDELDRRKLARKLDLDALDMDRYKRHFDNFDEDGSGQIEKDEFEEMLYKCLHIPRHIGLPQSRVQQLWSAADKDGGGGIDLEEFIVFYQKYFAQEKGARAGIDSYYSQGLSANLGRSRASASSLVSSAAWDPL
jgi:Ca2+-binding EF-hand superfamily protein